MSCVYDPVCGSVGKQRIEQEAVLVKLLDLHWITSAAGSKALVRVSSKTRKEQAYVFCCLSLVRV